MTQRIVYFAYGSNMALERLRSRVPSAERICCGLLSGHQLKFHKRGRADGSGKCDAEHTGNPNDKVLGVLYSIRSDELPFLDKVEGCGHGYERHRVKVASGTNDALDAETYIATDIASDLRPFDWYKEHVLRGARAADLPADYIASIDAVIADEDPDDERRALELGIYG